jgi:hypothetical protein
MSTTYRNSEDFDGLTPADASRLLRLGMNDERRPIDDLIDYLNEAPTKDRLTGLLSHETFGLEEPHKDLVDGQASAERLRDVKDMSKVLYKRGKNREERMTGMAGYFLSVAAALAHHQQRICSRNREELDQLLLDLAEVAPDPWSTLLNQATETPWK